MSIPYTFDFSDLQGDVVLVADGMGGHRGGDHASKLAADAFLLNDRPLNTLDELASFLEAANRSIFDAADEDMGLRGMGTTVAGVICNSDALLWFNVGDSKVYRFRDEFLQQLSVDDVASTVVVSGAAKAGLTQALGGARQFLDIEPHIGIEPLAPGWRYLICSDGLTDVVPTSSIEQILTQSDKDAAQLLLDMALAKGAPDNVSIILITVWAETSADRGT
jgi:serine/threonine protein phosphatase PrpC